jgi:hypothetical protein
MSEGSLPIPAVREYIVLCFPGIPVSWVEADGSFRVPARVIETFEVYQGVCHAGERGDMVWLLCQDILNDGQTFVVQIRVV